MKFVCIQRIKNILYCVGFSTFVFSCGAKKATHSLAKKNYKNIPASVKNEGLRRLESNFSGKTSMRIDELLKEAEQYLGTPYKFGGTTPSGFDCSGFTLRVFEKADYSLPRRSSDQSEIGEKISVDEVKPGDLLFFHTSGGTKISHVGIVHDIGEDGEIRFIHASTSKGVTISSLNEKYWNKAFSHASRVLQFDDKVKNPI